MAYAIAMGIFTSNINFLWLPIGGTHPTKSTISDAKVFLYTSHCIYFVWFTS